MVIGSGGSELRVSPITETDLDYNHFTASVRYINGSLHQTIHFKIRGMAIDQGLVYPGASLMLNLPTFVSLPAEAISFRWYLESDPDVLPSNMQTSSSGSVLTVHELRKEQEGVIACAVYTNLGVLAVQRRFLIKGVDQEKLTVWCALWAGGIIGPYFFKNDEGHNVTVNADRYRAMITNFFIPELSNQDVQELWFQQDGATCHTARATIDLLKDTFGDRLISRFGPVNWPPRSCDLTPLDCFLWGYVKSLVYADKPQTLDHLEDNIHRVIADIRPQMLEEVIENWTSRLDYIRTSRGIHMPEIIFKM
ncbi:transposable element Tc3 transposase [Trichonephila clavipes]|nr:transposable element Tc3 transposase [Trichonephila clavipes]